MASRQAQKRLTKEYRTISENPPPYIIAKPNEENILEWHYIITGPDNTPFAEGQYHGILRFPAEYPFKPPSISVITPNGRFACNTRLCLSMSDYHPDTWNPAWSVTTILTGLLSFMTGDEVTTGSINTSENVKKRLAKESKNWNVTDNQRFKKIFPDLVEQNRRDIQAMKQRELEETKVASQRQEKEVSVNIKDLDLLDPEDRARLLVEPDDLNGLNLRVTIIGVVLAALIAAYFSVNRRG